MYDTIAKKTAQVHLNINHECKAQLLALYAPRLQDEDDGNQVLKGKVAHDIKTQADGNSWSCGYRCAAILLELLYGRDPILLTLTPTTLCMELIDLLRTKCLCPFSNAACTNRQPQTKRSRSTTIDLCSSKTKACQECLGIKAPKHLIAQSSLLKRKRAAKDDWIECNMCKMWYHLACLSNENVCRQCQM
uniref:Zinc finger PHD-type domain-containing protein n=1 Tax=Plectus sambesii TaxID=2011161 RepID=A0A914X4E9_9BILA